DAVSEEKSIVRPVSTTDDEPTTSGNDEIISEDSEAETADTEATEPSEPSNADIDSSFPEDKWTSGAQASLSNGCPAIDDVGQGLVDEILASTTSSESSSFGGGLAAPMPATVWSISDRAPAGPTHAWRTLTSSIQSGAREVWSLPRPTLKFELT